MRFPLKPGFAKIPYNFPCKQGMGLSETGWQVTASATTHLPVWEIFVRTPGMAPVGAFPVVATVSAITLVRG